MTKAVCPHCYGDVGLHFMGCPDLKPPYGSQLEDDIKDALKEPTYGKRVIPLFKIAQGLALAVLLFSFPAVPQSIKPAFPPGHNNASGISVMADGQVLFDWRAVESCARNPANTACRIAWAARNCGR
jgi:hypothetical protein